MDFPEYQWRHDVIFLNFKIVQSMFPPTYMLNKTTFIAKTEKRHVPTIWNWSVYPPTHMLNKTTFISKTEKRHVAIIWISKCKSTHALLNISHFLWNNGTRPVKICKTISCHRNYNVLMTNGKKYVGGNTFWPIFKFEKWRPDVIDILENPWVIDWKPKWLLLKYLEMQKSNICFDCYNS